MRENRIIYLRCNKFTDLFLENIAMDLAEINTNTYIPVIFKAVHPYGFSHGQCMQSKHLFS